MVDAVAGLGDLHHRLDGDATVGLTGEAAVVDAVVLAIEANPGVASVGDDGITGVEVAFGEPTVGGVVVASVFETHDGILPLYGFGIFEVEVGECYVLASDFD